MGGHMAAIKVVAVDEDGTFLRDHRHYDEERFASIYCRMRARGVRFVVATGNQCYQVQGIFGPYVRRMGIVSANGSYVLDGTEEVFCARAEDEAVAQMIRACHQMPEVPFAMLGARATYVERGTSQEFFDDMATYNWRQAWVDDFAQVDDRVFMFSSVVAEEEAPTQIERFRSLLRGAMDVVGSGEGYFDVVCPGVSKATGLMHLLRRWGVWPEECVAFGDSENDVAMLNLVGCGYAMDGAPSVVREAADRIAPPCAEDGVLQVLDELF